MEYRSFREDLLRISKKWSPYRTYACLHLWHWKDNSPLPAAPAKKKAVLARKKAASPAKKKTAWQPHTALSRIDNFKTLLNDR